MIPEKWVPVFGQGLSPRKRGSCSANKLTSTMPDRSRLLALALALPLAFLALAAAGLVRAQEHKDREFRECPDCPEMVGIPAGEFMMGSPPSEVGRFDSEGPQHPVTVAAFA